MDIARWAHPCFAAAPAGLLLAAALGAPAAAAEDAAPQALVQRVYALYTKPGSPGMPSSDERALSAFFEPSLAHAWAANGAKMETSESLDGVLDYDPFIEGQDFKITAVSVSPARVAGDCATVDASFRNFGKPTRLHYTLARSAGGWRIDDFRSGTSGSFRKRLRLPDSGRTCPAG